MTNAHVVNAPQTEYQQQTSPLSSSAQQNAQNNTNPVNKSNVVPLFLFQRGPMNIESCPLCNEYTRTRTVSSPNFMTYIAGLIILFVFWPLCWVPFVNDKCKRTDHYCAKCHGLIGSAEPFEGCCVTIKS